MTDDATRKELGVACGLCGHLVSDADNGTPPGAFVLCLGCLATCTKREGGWGPWVPATRGSRHFTDESVAAGTFPKHGGPVEEGDLRLRVFEYMEELRADASQAMDMEEELGAERAHRLYSGRRAVAHRLERLLRETRSTPSAKEAAHPFEPGPVEPRVADLEQRVAAHNIHLTELVRALIKSDDDNWTIRIVCPDEETARKQLATIRSGLEREGLLRVLPLPTVGDAQLVVDMLTEQSTTFTLSDFICGWESSAGGRAPASPLVREFLDEQGWLKYAGRDHWLPVDEADQPDPEEKP